MAANFWASSQCQRWMVSKEELGRIRSGIQQRTNFGMEKELLLQSHFIRLIQAIGKKLRFKQVVIATATTFFKRFYLYDSALENDPRIVAPTVLYLAVKVEEMGQLRPDHILSENNAKPDGLKVKPADIFACEIVVLEKLKFDLVVFHPYQDLERFVIDATQDASGVFTSAWGILNDVQRSDCALIYPPAITGLAALYIACVQVNADIKPWFDELNVNLDQVRECAMDILDASKADEERGSKAEIVLQELDQHWRSSQLL